jgi:uncharacterized protein (DUF2126 family)/transglutaminase-like putative cysteine protease
VRLLIRHDSRYEYGESTALGPHLVRLRPAVHAKAKIESYALRISPEPQVRWQQDPSGNRVARATFPKEGETDTLCISVELAVEVTPVNPFDFYVDDTCETVPFEYSPALRAELAPFLEPPAKGPLLDAFLESLPRSGPTVSFIVSLNEAVKSRTSYVLREETGVWTPEQTLAEGRGSCRDSATLLVAALRSRGIAARFVSGYLVQLADEGMLPDAPKGVSNDVVDLHAWAEAYVPGAGWIGLDATSGLLCGEGHIPLACAASSATAAPLDGTSSRAPVRTSFEMSVRKIGHDPRPTKPYEEHVWEEMLEVGDETDKRVAAHDLVLTMGAEPTFNAREGDLSAPEWNGAALGKSKWEAGLRMAAELRRKLAPGAAMLVRMGKHYPGEELPRWALELVQHPQHPWPDFTEEKPAERTEKDAKRFAEAIAERLGVSRGLTPAYEDPWRFVQDEASLPVDVDPLAMDLSAAPLRQQLALVLDRGLNEPSGYVIPLARRDQGGAERWVSERWKLRRGHVFLLRGTSPMGLRLPLASLSEGEAIPDWIEEKIEPRDPRRPKEKEEDPNAPGKPVRTALCVEAREGKLWAFLPPFEKTEHFFALLRELDAVRRETGLDVQLEGYPPPGGDPELFRMAVTPDPGVLEINLPPTRTARAHADICKTVFDAALASGLHAEKYMIDGRLAGSGGGHHLTLGGPTALESPFLKRPDLLASLLTFVQHHPSLSFAFSGLFVGPTSQAPRVDEARHDTLYELEIALEHAFSLAHEQGGEKAHPPWLADSLFRHLLVDVTGNTHRAEICIDKLYDPRSPHGRQGLVEMRAFEMPRHPRMMAAQMLLVRALVASFLDEPYQRPLVRFGQVLHDRYLLPYFLERDLGDVLEYLAARGLPLPKEGYQLFVDHRCPLVGTLNAGDVTVELRNAIEPWHVLGEEASGTGTARYVDSSLERIEVRARGLVEGRHRLLVNGISLPMHRTAFACEHVAGVRFRAWAPPHSLHPHIGVHHPVRIDVLDSWAKRSLGACAYHVWHPEGRSFDTPPLTRFEAEARRAQRFTEEGPLPYPVAPREVSSSVEAPYTLDLRRFAGDRHLPPVEDEKDE